MERSESKNVPAKMMAFKSTLSLMQSRYPLAFPKANTTAIHPLKLKIHEDIHAAIDAGELDISRLKIRNFLRYWCNAPFYKKALVAGAARVDLNGQPAGVVTQQEIERDEAKGKREATDNQGSTDSAS